MPISPVSTTTANNIVTNPVTTQPASTTGLSNSQSSMSSYQTTGILTAVWNWISGLVEVSRSFLATIPFIGRLFEVAPRIRSEDELRYDEVKGILDFEHPIYGQYADDRAPVRNDTVDHALTVFRQIQDPHYQAKAFLFTVTSRDSTDYAAREFYNALPEESQRKFREQIYIANGRNDNNHGIGFGEHIVATDIRGRLASEAAWQFALETRH